MSEKVIKIIDVKKKIVDLATVSEEDLDDILLVLSETNPNITANITNGIKIISSAIQNPPYTLFNKNENIIHIDLRNLFYNTSIIPVIDLFGANAFAETNTNIYKTKLPNRTLVLYKVMAKNNKEEYKLLTLASEEMVSITHILIPHKQELRPLFNNMDYYLGYYTYLSNGCFSSWLLEYLYTTKSTFDYHSKNDIHLTNTDFNSAYDIQIFNKYIGDNVMLPIEKYKYIYNKNKDILLFAVNNYLIPTLLNINIPKNKNTATDIKSFVIPNTVIYNTWMSKEEKAILFHFLKKIYEIYNIDYDFHIKYVEIFNINAINELYKFNALPIYYFVLTDNKNPIIEQYYKNQKAIINIKKRKNEIYKKKIEYTNKIKIYLLLILEKLGKCRTNDIMSALINDVSNLTKILDQLTKHEKEIIDVAYTNYMALIKSYTENKCPHLNLCRKLRTSSSIQMKKKIEEVLKFAKKENTAKADKDWIICNKCNFPLICPHVIDKLQAESDLKTYDETMAILNKYVNKVATNNNLFVYYCSICSETIAELNQEIGYSSQYSQYGDINNDIRIKLWSILTNAFEYLEFEVIINPKLFINEAIQLLYAIISKLSITNKTDLSKSMYQEDSTIDPLVEFYCIIFSYVYILHSIIKNKKINFKGVHKGSKSSKYAEEIVKLIIKKYYLLITRLGLKSEYINKKFIEAYQYLEKNLHFEDGEINKNDIVYQTATTDSIYKYAKFMYLFQRIKNNAIETKNTKIYSDEVYLFHQIMGNTVEDFDIKSKKLQSIHMDEIDFSFFIKQKEVNFYADLYTISDMPTKDIADLIHDSKSWKLDKALKKGGTPLKKGLPKSLKKGPSKSLAKDAPSSKNDPSPELNITEFISNRGTKGTEATKGTKSIKSYENAIFYESYNLFHEYVTKLYNHKEYNNFLIRLNDFKKIEYRFYLVKKFFSLNSYFYFPAKHTTKYKKHDLKISKLYDEQGIKHKWDIYCYEDEELTIAELLKKDSWSDPLLDIKCSICNIRKSNTKTLDCNKIEKALKSSYTIDTFFIFYQTRCPEENLHNFENNICTKCGIQYSFITNKDENSKKYYNKYYPLFKEITDEIRNRHHIEKLEFLKKNEIAEKIKIKIPKEIDFSYVAKLSKLFNIDINIIEEIGCTQLRSFQDIKDGKNKKNKPPISITEINNANAEMRYLFVMYSLLLNAETNVDPDILNVLESANVPKYEYKNLKKYLPIINIEEYNTNFFNIRAASMDATNNISMNDTIKYIIHHLSYYIITIAEHSYKDNEFTEPLCLNFSKFIINTIVKNQKLLSTPLHFTWKYFSEVEDDYLIKEGEDGAGDDNADIIEDVNIDGEGENDNLFSAENIDYDLNGENEEDNQADIDF